MESSAHVQVPRGSQAAFLKVISAYEDWAAWVPSLSACTVEGDDLDLCWDWPRPVQMRVHHEVQEEGLALRLIAGQIRSFSLDCSLQGEQLRATVRLGANEAIPGPLRRFFQRHAMDLVLQALVLRVAEVGRLTEAHANEG